MTIYLNQFLVTAINITFLFSLETRPCCNHCKRLKLNCSYDVIYQWGEEALENGKTFGRSNQYKKAKLQSQYDNLLNNEFDSFLSAQTSTLSQHLQHQNIPWLSTKNKTYFINVTQCDFKKTICTTMRKPEPNGIYSPVVHVLSSVMNDNCLLKSLEDGFQENVDIADFNFNDNSTLDSLDLDFMIPTYDWKNDLDVNSLTTELSACSNTSLLFPVISSIDTSLPTMMLQSNEFYKKFKTLSNENQKIINYFIDAICPTCVCFADPNFTSPGCTPVYFSSISATNIQWTMNPYLYLIIPLALNNQVVLNSVLAATSYQLYLSGDKMYKKVSETYLSMVMVELPHIIREKQYTFSMEWDDVLATILMLCFTEVSTNYGAREIWKVYLNCAKFFVKQINCLNASTPLGMFFSRYFVNHNVIGGTAVPTEENDFNHMAPILTKYLKSHGVNFKDHKFMKQILKENFGGDLYLDTLKHGDTVINIAFGCCQYLYCLTHQVSNLGECCEGLQIENLQTKQELGFHISLQATELGLKIQNLNQVIPTTSAVTLEFESVITDIAEIKRLSVLLYLYIRVDLELFYQSGEIATNSFLNKKFEMEKNKAQIVKLLRGLPSNSSSLVWPLFILGLICSQYEAQRWVVLDKIAELCKMRNSKGMKTIKDTILQIWKEVDLELKPFRWNDLINDRAELLSISLIS